MKKNINLLTIVFFLALILSLVIKVLSVWCNNFPFTYDQGRDLVDLRQMLVTHTPRLVGPTTSINGLLLGPFYYYFIFIPFLLFGGSPMSIVLWQIVWYELAVVILWLILKKRSLTEANIAGTILFLLPTGFYTARYFWNANMIPIFAILFIASLIYCLADQSFKRTLFVGFIAGLSLQIEAAFGVLLFPFAILFLLLRRFSLKSIFGCILGFFITLLPQILFEFRHGFLMTKTLLGEFSGKTDILGGKISLHDRLPERIFLLINSIRDTNHIPLEALRLIYPVLIIFGIYLLIKKKKEKRY